MPIEGWTEKGIESVDELNIGLKAFPLQVAISRRPGKRERQTDVTTLVRRLSGFCVPGTDKQTSTKGSIDTDSASTARASRDRGSCCAEMIYSRVSTALMRSQTREN